MTIEDMFAVHGEPYFREGKKRVIRRIWNAGRRSFRRGRSRGVTTHARGDREKRNLARADVPSSASTPLAVATARF